MASHFLDLAEGGPPQQPVEGLPEELFDVLVVGAGPAGSTAAIHLASRGHRVLLVDKERFPREKPCGDGLTFRALRCLERLGLGEAVRQTAHRVERLVVYSPSRVEAELSARFLTLRRIKLDALLAERAVRAGATFRQGEVRDLQQQADGTVAAFAAGREAPLRARIGVLATGAALRLAERVGMASRSSPSVAAIRCYVRSPLAVDRMTTIYTPWLIPGYAWVFPLGEGEYNVGCAALSWGSPRRPRHLKAAFERVKSEFPLVRDLFRSGEIATPWRGAMLRTGLRGAGRLVERNILAIGETIGSTLPFTGEGVGLAMETGELAAAAIHEALASGASEALRAYPARVNEALRPVHLAHRLAQAAASVGWMNDFLARRSRSGGCLHGLAASAITGEAITGGAALWRGAFRLLARLAPRRL